MNIIRVILTTFLFMFAGVGFSVTQAGAATNSPANTATGIISAAKRGLNLTQERFKNNDARLEADAANDWRADVFNNIRVIKTKLDQLKKELEDKLVTDPSNPKYSWWKDLAALESNVNQTSLTDENRQAMTGKIATIKNAYNQAIQAVDRAFDNIIPTVTAALDQIGNTVNASAGATVQSSFSSQATGSSAPASPRPQLDSPAPRASAARGRAIRY